MPRTCGVLPQRFSALVPRLKGKVGGAGYPKHRPPFNLGPWVGARTCSSALPYPPPRSFRVVAWNRTLGNLPAGCAGRFAFRSGLFEFAIALGKDQLFETSQLVGWSDEANRTVQEHRVVMSDISSHFASRFVERLELPVVLVALP